MGNNPQNSKKYLFEIRNEPLFVKEILKSILARQMLIGNISTIPERFIWLADNILTSTILPDYNGSLGEIDLIAGLYVNGEPQTDLLIAVEVKYVNFKTPDISDKNLPLHSGTGIPQTIALKKMGFDYVWLVYFLVKPPTEGRRFWDWVDSGDFKNARERLLNIPWKDGEKLCVKTLEEGIGFLLLATGEVALTGNDVGGSNHIEYCSHSFCNLFSNSKLNASFGKVVKDAFDRSKTTLHPLRTGPLLLMKCSIKTCKKFFFTDALLTKKFEDKCPECRKTTI
ncbi:MAG: hypothetical protein HY769_06795 [Candidatus Stahlbacteria bacterium]|nr:hypothetical protein [Candidatus Stahlbacteria bacterium]